MRITELDYEYPENLIATEPRRPSRVLVHEAATGLVRESSITELLDRIPAGDVLALNDTRVVPRRVFAGPGTGAGPGADLEILFVEAQGPCTWQVLFPAKSHKVGDRICLPDGVTATLTAKGRPQVIETDRALDITYFETHGQLPLPPYIQRQRGERVNRAEDRAWYQTAWAEVPGSSAAPTASLHFTKADLLRLEARGVKIVTVTLHVGLGTYLPVQTENLREHPMHHEAVTVTTAAWETIQQALRGGSHVWALGTTVTRALESVALGTIPATARGFQGSTDLLILPGHDWKVITRLLTNFHQPRSTLLALVCAFAGRENVLAAYAEAVAKKFRLFSYGDLSAWIK